MKLGNRKLKGFTLVELIMVLAIIALLTSIMMPTLHKARGLAMSTVCRGNLRQLGVGFGLYSSDNDMFIPWSYYGYEPPSSSPWRYTSWEKHIYPYINDQYTPLASAASLLEVVMLCPSIDTDAAAGYSSYACYAMSGAAGGFEYPPTYTRPPFGTHCRISAVDNMSEVFLLGEKEPGTMYGAYCIPSYVLYPSVTPSQYNFDYGVAFRHDGCSNWTFFDGHVESRDGLRVWTRTEVGRYLYRAYSVAH